MAAMNRRRTALYQRLTGLGHPPSDALAIVNEADTCMQCAGARAAAKRPGDRGWCAGCGRTWAFDPRTATTARLAPVNGGLA